MDLTHTVVQLWRHKSSVMALGQVAHPQHTKCLVLTPVTTNPQTDFDHKTTQHKPTVHWLHLGIWVTQTDGLHLERFSDYSSFRENRITYKVKGLFLNRWRMLRVNSSWMCAEVNEKWIGNVHAISLKHHNKCCGMKPRGISIEAITTRMPIKKTISISSYTWMWETHTHGTSSSIWVLTRPMEESKILKKLTTGFINVFTKARNWTLSWVTWIQSTSSHYI